MTAVAMPVMMAARLIARATVVFSPKNSTETKSPATGTAGMADATLVLISHFLALSELLSTKFGLASFPSGRPPAAPEATLGLTATT